MPARQSHKKTKARTYAHIYNKGLESIQLFKNKKDCKTFLGFLEEYLTPPPSPEKLKKSFSVNGKTFKGVPHQPKNYHKKIKLIAYSLLPNHFHLVLHERKSGSLEKLMRSLSTRYAIYYNKKYKRKGSLFSGPYKSVNIEDKIKLLFLTRYIHREAVEQKSEGKLAYSSYKEYIKDRKSSWINEDTALTIFETVKENYVDSYQYFVEKYSIRKDEAEMLQQIILEDKVVEYFEENLKEPQKAEAQDTDSILAPEPKSRPKSKTTKPRSVVPKFIALATTVWVLLFTAGLNNVLKASPSARADIASLSPSVISFLKTGTKSDPTPTKAPQVSGIKDKSETKVEETSPTEEKTKDTTFQKKVIITITDGANAVNIRSKPTTSSEILGKAEDGESFEFISKVPSWYQIEFDDENAFVHSNYAQLNEGESNETE